LDNNPRSQRTSTGVFQFPADTITDEDAALTWWEQEFAPTCEAVGAQVNAALLVRQIVVSLRRVRETALAETMSLTEAAERTGYSVEHIGRLVRQAGCAKWLQQAARRAGPKKLDGSLWHAYRRAWGTSRKECRSPTLPRLEAGAMWLRYYSATNSGMKQRCCR
jgi:hypothetical protein